MDELIRAAGGVVIRPGDVERSVAVVHRPRYDDWSLPKGKLLRGEHPVVGACREVWEETGVRARAYARLPSASYQTPLGSGTAEKLVDYWAMTALTEDGFVAGSETDALEWLPVDLALGRLTYPRDVTVLTAFKALPAITSAVVLVRHATAGSRKQWRGPDRRRPLDKAGEARALRIVEVLQCFGPTQLVSASPERCRQTLRPTAAALGLEVAVDERFDEGADPAQAEDAIRAWADAASGPLVICSQGKAIPPLLGRLSGAETADFRTPKGTGWVLAFDGSGRLSVVDRLA